MLNNLHRLQVLIEVFMLEQQIRRVNHPLHMVATIMTAGLWAIVWIVDCINTRNDNERLRARIKGLRFQHDIIVRNGDMGDPDIMSKDYSEA